MILWGLFNSKADMLDPSQVASTTKPPRERLRLYPGVPLPLECVQEWNTILMPRINKALAKVYREDPRSVEISLESIGRSPKQTIPTILVICSPVKRVRAELKKRLGSMFMPHSRYALRVCRGSLVRSSGDVHAANGSFQERPGLGASIGAWAGDRHLPPVSFGGLILVDGKQYGMTVHHMLDDPEDISAHESGETHSRGFPGSARRSIATPHDIAYFRRLADPVESDEGEQFTCDFSSSDSEEDRGPQPVDDDEADMDAGNGDIPGIEPGCGDGYIVTQPALDDIEDGFFTSLDTMDEDHLDAFSLGEVYASSGIRRRKCDRGLIHEVDWALFEFQENRCPELNDLCLPTNLEESVSPSTSKLTPKSVVPASSLPNLKVQCCARTSGLQTGIILPTLCSIKIYGRKSASNSYQVAKNPQESNPPGYNPAMALPIGLPGDSGAWVVERENGQLCGHILAWSQRKRVSYMCPMDVLLLDIAETLEAEEVRLPGGEPIVHIVDNISIDDLGDLFDDDEADEVKLT